jgi:hypothetical protein
MKNQYFGDINDYRKYGLLRCLGAAGLKIGVCWLLTPDDRKGNGELRTYLTKPELWRHYDPQLYDGLQRLSDPEVSRTVRHAEEWRLVPGARYFTHQLPDEVEARDAYFTTAYATLEGKDLIFFDPDVGLEVPSTRRGARGSAAYLYWCELTEAFGRGHSVLFYQHYPHVNRSRFVPFLAHRLSGELGLPYVSAFVTPYVVFFLVWHSKHRRTLSAAVQVVRRLWQGQIEPWPDTNDPV